MGARSSSSSSPSAVNYAYGLSIESFQPSLDLQNAANTLEIRLLLRNAAGAPIKFLVDLLETKICETTVTTRNRGAILDKDSETTFFPDSGLQQKSLCRA